jgi:hypothetical protein
MLHKSVLDNVTGYLRLFEGYYQTIYRDSKGIATTGIGNRVEPYSTYGRRFVFYRFADHRPASEAEVLAEISACKVRPYTPKVYTTDGQIQNITLSFFKSNAELARQYFGSGFDWYPADVQVVLAQIGYAGGLPSRKNSLDPYLKKRDWVGAMSHTSLGTGYKKYDAAFRVLMTNGWIVDQCRLKGSAMKNWAPTDYTFFWGIRNFLQVSRWYAGDTSFEIRTSDSFTRGDCTEWLQKKTNY